MQQLRNSGTANTEPQSELLLRNAERGENVKAQYRARMSGSAVRIATLSLTHDPAPFFGSRILRLNQAVGERHQ